MNIFKGISFFGAEASPRCMNLDPELMHVRKVGEGSFRSLLIFNAFSSQDEIVIKYLEKLKNDYSKDPSTKIMSFISNTFIIKVLQQLKKYVTDSIQNIIIKQCHRKFSIQIDGTTDITSKAQYSLVVRYCTPDLIIHDRTVKFVPLESSKGKDICDFIEKVLKEMNLRITDMVGLCTDGASSMTGEITGLCGSIHKKNPFVVFVWCVCHRFDLCIKNAIKQHDEINDMLQYIHDFSVFIHGSAPVNV